MLDSGASCNFISASQIQALGLSDIRQQKYSVRLANGKMLQTIGKVHLNIRFGTFHYFGPFHVLQCAVPLILGMTFLASVKPEIDFVKKQVFVESKRGRIGLPSVKLVNGKVAADSGNMFSGLEVEPVGSDDVDNDPLGSSCDDDQKVAQQIKKIRVQCQYCDKLLSNTDQQVCKRCQNHSQCNLRSQSVEKFDRS